MNTITVGTGAIRDDVVITATITTRNAVCFTALAIRVGVTNTARLWKNRTVYITIHVIIMYWPLNTAMAVRVGVTNTAMQAV